MTTRPTIAIIIPARNAAATLPQVLAAAQANAPDELIVVADGSRDETAGIAAAWRAQVLRLAESQGPAVARNCAAHTARCDIVFFVDADVVLPANAVSLVVNYFTESPAVSALFGSYDAAPAAPNFVSQYKNLLHHYVHQTSAENAVTFWAGCGAIRREVFLAVGGFAETYRTPSIEDIELGARLVQAGYLIRLAKNLQAKHLKHWTLCSLVRSDFFDRALPWSRLIVQRRDMPRTLNLAWQSRVSVGLVWLLLALVVVSGWWSVGGLLLSCMVGLLVLNGRVYQFFVRQRGWWFGWRAIPLHWLYYFYSGLALAWTLLRR